MDKSQLKPEFLQFYRENVRPVAEKCANGFHIISAMENGKPVDEKDKELLNGKPVDEKDKELLNSRVDAEAIWHVGCMIGIIDKAAIGGMNLNVINSVSQIQGCLNSESYWQNVWNNDFSTEEAKNLKELGSKMNKLVEFI